jgi:hypothetical protein
MMTPLGQGHEPVFLLWSVTVEHAEVGKYMSVARAKFTSRMLTDVRTAR